jgi:hypothetical protein
MEIVVAVFVFVGFGRLKDIRISATGVPEPKRPSLRAEVFEQALAERRPVLIIGRSVINVADERMRVHMHATPHNA